VTKAFGESSLKFASLSFGPDSDHNHATRGVSSLLEFEQAIQDKKVEISKQRRQSFEKKRVTAIGKMTTVDIHTHIYPPSFMALLRSRTTVPYIRTDPSSPTSRLIILPNDDDPSLPPSSRGRPIGPDYHDVTKKLEFMATHNITTSVISLANPWLDFLPSHEAAAAAKLINNEMDEICAQHEGRLFAFGTLPLSAPPSDIIAEVHRLRTLPHTRGVIMGTTGLGSGLDDPTLDPVWAALAETSTLVFLHPHYGLPSSVYGPRASEYGHLLPLALGFPLETTIAVSRMFLSRVFERFEGLRVLLAHSGGALPFLAGRVESCVQHERSFGEERRQNRKGLCEVFRTNLFLDAVIYSDVGLKTAVDSAGPDRVLFGECWLCLVHAWGHLSKDPQNQCSGSTWKHCESLMPHMCGAAFPFKMCHE